MCVTSQLEKGEPVTLASSGVNAEYFSQSFYNEEWGSLESTSDVL